MGKLSVAGFTNLGYQLHARGFEPIGADLSGKTAVVTGGSDGLGLEVARSLAALGAHVVIVARNPTRLEEASRLIDGDATPISADLSLMTEVRNVAERLASSEDGVSILVNNVGVLLPERSVTEEGIETTLATNLAGHFVLTNLLVPTLIESGHGRIVNISSGGMYTERLRPDDLQYEKSEYRGAAAYARTKRAQVVLTEMWAKRLQNERVVVHAMHPGWARTAGVAQSLPTFNFLMRPFLRTPQQGADTITWLAAAPEPARSTGGFWFDRSPAPTHLLDSTHERPGDREDLWDRLVDLTGTDLRV
jgi:NAD(P)-dependent dehydrogenase (short-subunit alcohol dehydrogenase family)